jgi:hypothetical protein
MDVEKIKEYNKKDKMRGAGNTRLISQLPKEARNKEKQRELLEEHQRSDFSRGMLPGQRSS